MIERLTQASLNYVLRNLRPADELEFRATIWSGNYAECVEKIGRLPGLGWAAHTPRGRPAVVGGFVPIWFGLASGWMFGTDEWNQVALPVTRFITRDILPKLDASGFHRIECRPMAGNLAVIRWLEMIGFTQEAVVAQFGQGREDFLLFARTALHERPPRPSQDQLSAGHA
jgi:hypothetical protein